MADHIPTVRQRRLAQSLRELRLKAGLTQEQVAAEMGWHSSKLFRLENARSPRVDWVDVKELLDLYGVASPQRDALIQLARDARRRGWWTPYSDVFTGSFVALEDAASLLRVYQSELVPGLLQTSEYARAVITAVRPGLPPEETERRVEARMARQLAVLDRDHSPQLVCLLNEAVVRRPVGGPSTMRAQLRRLTEIDGRPDVAIRIIPFGAGAHAAIEGPFVLFQFPEEHAPDVAYVEGAMGDLYLESVEEVQRYTLLFERICELALDVEETAKVIAAAAEEL
ncbi:helix-turn-helix transcriptional regulator [Sphaerisporangium sp. NPDC051017]|uniref:helix-turn-helix domain-containing protein n=1 Tax=Sphaerisporangium sp. NPDC051017 TaxID=3154636 RepID=UPI0034212F57